MPSDNQVHLTGKGVSISEGRSDETLLNWLRQDIDGHCGTKEGCAEGDCGACSVVISDTNLNDEPMWRVVNSCILFLPALHGREVITVEGLSKPKCELHPTQTAMVELNGSQCGYCTPGFMMTLAEAAHRDDLDEPWKFHDQLSGNLCRCTGYRPIRESLRVIAGSQQSVLMSERLQEVETNLPPLDYQTDSTAFGDLKFSMSCSISRANTPTPYCSVGVPIWGFLRPNVISHFPNSLQLRVSLSCVHSRLARRDSTWEPPSP